jgi:hypothetical protein
MRRSGHNRGRLGHNASNLCRFWPPRSSTRSRRESGPEQPESANPRGSSPYRVNGARVSEQRVENRRQIPFDVSENSATCGDRATMSASSVDSGRRDPRPGAAASPGLSNPNPRGSPSYRVNVARVSEQRVENRRLIPFDASENSAACGDQATRWEAGPQCQQVRSILAAEILEPERPRVRARATRIHESARQLAL